MSNYRDDWKALKAAGHGYNSPEAVALRAKYSPVAGAQQTPAPAKAPTAVFRTEFEEDKRQAAGPPEFIISGMGAKVPNPAYARWKSRQQ